MLVFILGLVDLAAAFYLLLAYKIENPLVLIIVIVLIAKGFLSVKSIFS